MKIAVAGTGYVQRYQTAVGQPNYHAVPQNMNLRGCGGEPYLQAVYGGAGLGKINPGRWGILNKGGNFRASAVFGIINLIFV